MTPQPPDGTASTPRARRAERVMFAALLAIHLAPIWMLKFIPTQDGPAEQGMVGMMRLWHQPSGAFLDPYIIRNSELLPNEAVFFLMGHVLRFLSIPTAERVVLSAYVLLLPLSLRYALTAISKRSAWLCVFAFPFVYGWTFHMGFVNFGLSLAGFLFALGFWWRHRGRHSLAGGVALMAIAAALYWCHVVSFAMVVAVVGTMEAWLAIASLRRRRSARGAEPIQRLPLESHLTWTVLAFLPSLALLATFAATHHGPLTWSMTLYTRVRTLATLNSLASVSSVTVVWSSMLALIIASVAATRWRRGDVHPAPAERELLLVAIAASLVLYFLAPTETEGGAYLVERLSLYPVLLTILWIGTFDFDGRARARIAGSAAFIAVAFVATLWPRWLVLGDYLSEEASIAGHLEAGRTLACLVYSPHGTGPDGRDLTYRTEPFLHACGAIAAERPMLDLLSFEAHSTLFPLRFRPDLDPYAHLASTEPELERKTPQADLVRYERETGERIDYVALWQFAEAPPDRPAVQLIKTQLAAAYTRIYVSPRGLVELYRHQ